VQFASASPEKRFASGKPWADPKGNDLWSVNVVVGDESETFVSGGPVLTPYPGQPSVTKEGA
jgi:hypothetical protein